LITVSNLSYSYPNGQKALSQVSFSIQKGESVALIGANGAGKSTLFQLILGILSPQDGMITIDQLPVEKKYLPQIRQKIGMVFQNPDDQLFMPSVYEDVIFAPKNYGYSDEDAKMAAEQALSSLEILQLKDRMPHQLSGGEKRRAALACVLSIQPQILLLDEPSSFLDPRAVRSLVSLLQQLPQTKLIATHNLDLAKKLCSRILILQKGTLCYDGSNEILDDPTRLYEFGL
jgi:cobalt/nickel transport system ATP-binding protein